MTQDLKLPWLAPSLLSADFSKLGECVSLVEKAGAQVLHVDVMDGHFVPNLTFGACVVESLRPLTKLPIDVHLMVENPQNLIPDFAKAGADWISVHVEAEPHLERAVSLIKSFGKKAGVVLNPATSLTTLDEILPSLDFVLLMSVNPGFGGQSFLSSAQEKISKLAQIRKNKNLKFLIEVDGGVKLSNVGEIVSSGADVVVAGSAVFGAHDVTQATKEFLQEMSSS